MLHIHFGKRVKFVQKPGHEDALYNKFVFFKRKCRSIPAIQYIKKLAENSFL